MNEDKICPVMFGDWRVRMHDYRIVGYTEAAFDDAYWGIRKEAYLVLGFTKKALKDTDTSITEEAKSFFELNLNYSKKS